MEKQIEKQIQEQIVEQIDLIDTSNKWIEGWMKDKPEKQKNAKRTLIKCRSELNRRKKALKGYPATAVY